MYLVTILASAILTNAVYAQKIATKHLAGVDIIYKEHSFPFQTVSGDLLLQSDLPDSPRIFIVPISSFINDTLFYFGITNMINAGIVPGSEKMQVDLGPGFMFTRWNTVDRACTRPPKNGYYLVGDFEGRHVGVRAPTKPKKGRYTFTLTKMDDADTKDGPATWVRASVYHHESRENCIVGELRFPGKDLVMSGINGSFFELPGLPILSPPERLPELFFSTGKWKKDGIPLKIDKITAVYPVMVPQKAHIVLSDAVPNAFKNKFPNLKTEDFPLSFLATNVVWKRKGVLQERSRGKVMAEDLFKTNQQ